MKLLIVEDDKEAAAYLKRALSEVGHTVDATSTGRSGLMLAAGETYDVIILDRMLPEIDGLAILRTIRASGVKTPVLLLTALGGIDDRVEGLEAGGDDYLVKPFALAELLARVNALARRPPTQEVRTELSVKLNSGNTLAFIPMSWANFSVRPPFGETLLVVRFNSPPLE